MVPTLEIAKGNKKARRDTSSCTTNTCGNKIESYFLRTESRNIRKNSRDTEMRMNKPSRTLLSFVKILSIEAWMR